MHADSVLENICAIGIIDGDALRAHLLRHGFDDARRSELQMLGISAESGGAEISGVFAFFGNIVILTQNWSSTPLLIDNWRVGANFHIVSHYFVDNPPSE